MHPTSGAMAPLPVIRFLFRMTAPLPDRLIALEHRLVHLGLSFPGGAFRLASDQWVLVVEGQIVA